MAASFSPNNCTIATCNGQGMSIWTLPFGARLANWTWDDWSQVVKVKYNNSEDSLGLLAERGLYLWHVPSGKELAFLGFEDGEQGVAFHFAENEIVCVVSCDHENPCAQDVRRISGSSDEKNLKFTKVVIKGMSVHGISADGSIAILCAEDSIGNFELWNLNSCRSIMHFEMNPFSLFSFSPDNRLLAQSHSEPSGVTIWETSTGSVVREISAVMQPLLCFSSTHRILATICNNSHCNIDRTEFLDPITGAVFGWTSEHIMSFNSNRLFSPRGKWFASGVTNADFSPDQTNLTPGGTLLLTDLTPLLAQAAHW